MKLEELIGQHENTITRIKTRLYFLLTFEKELIKLTRGKPFTIRNDIAYRAIFDVWDMLVIDFASLGRGMLGGGGFFNTFKANLGEFKPLKKRDIDPPPGTIHSEDPISEDRLEQVRIELNQHFIETIHKARQELLHDLFPKLKTRSTGRVNHEDVDDLKLRFERIVSDVVADRDNNRAHRYENLKSQTGQPKIDFKKLESKFQEIEKILNAIKIVSTGVNFSYSDMNYINKDRASHDLISLILWGTHMNLDHFSGINKQLNSAPQDSKIYGYMIREKFLEDSHKKHGELQEKIEANPDHPDVEKMKKLCFNDMHFEENEKW